MSHVKAMDTKFIPYVYVLIKFRKSIVLPSLGNV